ncbi:MAG: hypothetical protein ACRDZ4_05805 [Egibacteraceae bacterium]
MAGEGAFFEVGVEGTERGRAFYEGLFGWRFESAPTESGFVIQAPNMPGKHARATPLQGLPRQPGVLLRTAPAAAAPIQPVACGVRRPCGR